MPGRPEPLWPSQDSPNFWWPFRCSRPQTRALFKAKVSFFGNCLDVPPNKRPTILEVHLFAHGTAYSPRPGLSFGGLGGENKQQMRREKEYIRGLSPT